VFGLILAVGGCAEAQPPTGASPGPTLTPETPAPSPPSTSIADAAATPAATEAPATTTTTAAASTTTAAASTTTAAATRATAPTVRPAPTAVRIPSIGVESVLAEMGIRAEDGAAEVPVDYGIAGWYANGARPGGRGPTVLVGHVDSTSGPAVFYRLRELVPGDQIEVQLADGTVALYEVETTQQFPKAELPIFEVFGATERDVLRLVTCTGEFDEEARSYFDNLVVTAVRV